MHGTITKTSKPDRAAIMRDAWALWREARAECAAWDAGLAAELHSRRNFIAAATDEADRARRIASVTWSYRQFVAGPWPAALNFAECLRTAWMRARWHRAPMTDFAARRFFAEMSDDDAVRLRELDQIDREERAATAA